MAIIFNPGLTYHFTETWNNGLTAFDGLSFDAQDTASAAGSNLLRLGVGGVDKLSVRKDSRIRYGPDANNHWSHLVNSVGDLAMTGVGSTGGALTVTPEVGKNINFNLSGAGDLVVNTNQFYVDTSAGNVGFGTASPVGIIHVMTNVENPVYLESSKAGTGGQDLSFRRTRSGGTVLTGDHLGRIVAWGHDGTAFLRCAEITAIATGTIATGQISTDLAFRTRNLGTLANVGAFSFDGNFGVGLVSGIAAKAHISQASTTAAIPALRLNQADLSEELIRFESTIGVGNPIEAIGAKTLTPTHLVRVHIQGVGNLYMQVGTAA